MKKFDSQIIELRIHRCDVKIFADGLQALGNKSNSTSISGSAEGFNLGAAGHSWGAAIDMANNIVPILFIFIPTE